MWKWQTRICICRQIVKALQNYFCQIESYFFSYGVESGTWHNKGFEITLMCDFSIPSNKTRHIFVESWIRCLHYEENSDENFITRHSFPLSLQNIPRYLMGSPWYRWIIFTFKENSDDFFVTRLHCFHCQQIFKCSDISWAAGRPRGIGE